ncbi:binding-protein-dependent transporter [Salmonella enterica subsp. enterica]|uniref:Binding-protein-dependent transporter n=1 Tax=Salmonella enterica I TaxID=59201 RepID=A0A447N7H9_SALET|nr:binding-protein-dependent transporter [Salmonella enterica subsp. enterica]
MPGASGEGVRASHAQTGVGNISDSHYRGGRGLDPEVIAEITHRYGFDKPLHERYFKMLRDYLSFDFGDSLFRSASVLTLIKDSLPVSITLGLWSTLIIYLVSIPLGIRKAVHNGSRFDVWSSAFIIIGYAIPAFSVRYFINRLFCRAAATTISFRYVAWSPPTLTRYRGTKKNHRLFVAYYAAGVGDRHRRFCRPDDADEKFVSRRGA